ncbi:uncharacterized protein V6R79_013124 [Siganus canaliculatus]
MGRYLGAHLCSSSVNKALRSYCKIRYLMSLFREYPCLAKTLPYQDLYRKSLQSLPCPSSFTRKPFKHLSHNNPRSAFCQSLRDFTKEVKHLQMARFYSSSNRNTFKAEAPIGIMGEAYNNFSLSSLGGRLGHSFSRLSRHINFYFRRKDVVPLAENACLVVTAPDYLGKSPRRSQSQRAARERKMSEGKDTVQLLKSKDKQESSIASLSAQRNSGLQLFHISSLATTFGESYSYVANHINSVFSRSFTKLQTEENLETLPVTRGRKQKRRIIKSTSNTDSQEAQIPAEKSSADQLIAEPTNISSSWDEGYRLFARHINKYFGAKGTEGVYQHRGEQSEQLSSTYKTHFSKQSTSQSQQTMSHLRKDAHASGADGLFHSSHNTTNFGENYFQMASHINQYFKGESGLDGDTDDNLVQLDPTSSTTDRNLTFMDYLRQPTAAIPESLRAYLKLGPLTQTGMIKPARRSPERLLRKKLFLSRRQAEDTTRVLIGNLIKASSPDALTACVEALNEHLIQYPSCKALMWQEKTAVTLLRKRRTYRDNQVLQSALRETLSLIGYMDPVKGRGIRVLSIDGGGTRGVVPLQVLKLLEAETGKKIHQLFDYICGVSTGAVLAFMLGLAHFSLEECADMYRRFGSEVFRQNPLVGTVKMGWSHSYYDTEIWEKILQEKLGQRVLIKTARDESSPKVSAVSAVVNWGTSPKAFVFRNYNHKPGSLSRYAGASGCQMWQAVRASSAAPGYFQEFTLQSDIHQDGGILLNNPCALAVHESRLLWPKQPFQCVLSLGTGRYDNAKRSSATSTSLRAKISNLICSATDTEGVHTLLDELLAPDVYFRFNPMLSAVVSLDESRPQALDQLQRDTQSYLERNRPKLARLCLVLGAERSAASRTTDWISERAWEMKQRWV